jgi:hypothetical protein
MILRDESNLKPAPLAHRFAASGLTFSSPRNDSYQVGNDEMNRHCLSSQILLSTNNRLVALAAYLEQLITQLCGYFLILNHRIPLASL